nr:hypothetical protein [Serratia plymuthica]
MHKSLFDCQEVRGRCAVFDNSPPDWAVAGKCAIHTVMLQAEKTMRDALAEQTPVFILGTVIAPATRSPIRALHPGRHPGLHG